jgi:hypothetical protein
VFTLIVNHLIFCSIAGARKEQASQVSDVCREVFTELEGKICMPIYFVFFVPLMGY